MKRILLVDDEPFLLGIYRARLEHANFHVTAAVDGIQALQHLRQGDYDLALLDMVMPVPNGLDILKKIRASSNYARASMPVVIMASTAHPHRIEEVMLLGANDYIIKEHLTPEEIVARTNKLIKAYV